MLNYSMTNNIIFFTIAVFFLSVIIFLISKKIINGVFKRISKNVFFNIFEIGAGEGLLALDIINTICKFKNLDIN